MMRKENAGSPGGTEVALDAADCLNLQQILQAFNSHISEEHAWALFYQASRCFQKCLDEGTAYYLPTELAHVLLHKDGTVHPSTLLHTGDDSSREKFKSEHEAPENVDSGESGVVTSTAITSQDGVANVVACFSNVPSQILLATAIVEVESRKGSGLVFRCLLDQGSQASFITESAVQALGLKEIPNKVHISGVGDQEESLASMAMVVIKLKSLYNPKFTVVVKAHVLNKLTSFLPSKKVAVQLWSELTKLKLADPKFDVPNKVDLLLGAEVYGQILLEGVIKGPPGCPVAQKTQFGWILSGQIHSNPAEFDSCLNNTVISMHTQCNDNELLRRFWELESDEISNKKKILSEDEVKCEEIFTNTTFRDDSGRYVVRLPFRDVHPSCKTGNFKEIATQLEKRLQNNPELKLHYTEVMKGYLQLKHMELVPNEQRDRSDVVYLPHHAVLMKGGFERQKWASNNKVFMERIGESKGDMEGNLEIGTVKETEAIQKVLGLTWNSRTDEFEYSVQLKPISFPVAKRKVISDISRLFDPLGWIAPTMITAQIFIQKLWISGIEWDQQLPPHLLQEWNTYRNDLSLLKNIRIPRWIHTKSNDKVTELHGYCDVSNDAYAAVVCIRIIHKNNGIYVNLVTAKTKVSPIKQVSTSRLELCGAQLLAILLLEVSETLEIPKERVYAWTDSSVVLAWLSSHQSRWKTFTVNRVSNILTVLDRSHWAHVRSKDNPANCASRGIKVSDYDNFSVWKQGPSWLSEENINYSPLEDCHNTNSLEGLKLVVNLAIVVYHALDYTHGEDEERLMSPDLESLITEMTAGNVAEDDEECALSEGSETSEGGRADTDDEGIERDSEPAPRRRRTTRKFMLKHVIERCIWHCGGSGARIARDTAAAHYRAVCRALVAEALELASFLARVRVGGARDLGAAEDSATHLDTLQFSDWARFWVQVIGELRMGVKLKKVNYSRTPIEYELTPYEILMDDIRSRRYTLRKVDGAIPQSVKKDAHAMILEFIRSRPPLKKASERKLPPPRREITPRERLLASIQVGRQLRPTPYSRRLSTSGSGSGPGGGDTHTHTHTRRGDVTPLAPPQRRLIKVDFDNLEDDDDDDDTETCVSPETCAPQPFPRHTVPQQAPPKPWKRTAYDLATQCPSRRASMRRHTVTHPACPPTDGAQSLPHSRPGSRASCGGAASLASSDADAQLGELSWSRSSLQDELIKSVSGSPTHQHKQWQDAIMSDDRLSLTLEEIVHIRSVLTKAELEVLPVEGRVKEDVEKRRVCFLCLKTRFGIFGPWGQKCKLCKKTVCQKCCSKMRIPTEHFAHVPVALLSPSLLPSPDDEQQSFPRSLMARLVSPDHSATVENSVGSAPSSPAAARRHAAASAPGSRGASALGYADALPARADGPGSMPCVSTPLSSLSTLERRARYGRSATGASAAERLRGVQMAVCHDCKAMVLQIIKSSRACRSASRDRALRHLTLDLAPVYTADC